MCTGAYGDALFDQKCPDLIDRGCPSGDKAGSNPMKCLQVQLILRLLIDASKIGTQRCFGNPFCIIVVILLPLDEGLGINRWNNPWLKAKLAQCSTDKVSAQTCFHTNNTTRKRFKYLDQCQALDLAAQDNVAIRVKANKVKDVLADINADGRKCLRFSSCRICHGILLLLLTGTVVSD